MNFVFVKFQTKYIYIKKNENVMFCLKKSTERQSKTAAVTVGPSSHSHIQQHSRIKKQNVDYIYT